jgi:hypothetical protein
MVGKTSSAAERNEAAREKAFMSPNSLVHFLQRWGQERWDAKQERRQTVVCRLTSWSYKVGSLYFLVGAGAC